MGGGNNWNIGWTMITKTTTIPINGPSQIAVPNNYYWSLGKHIPIILEGFGPALMVKGTRLGKSCERKPEGHNLRKGKNYSLTWDQGEQGEPGNVCLVIFVDYYGLVCSRRHPRVKECNYLTKETI
ncbi:hypothetical protein Ddc_09508 [Ditylenchus destructor]|nr:hypothetical protein Ddc_09508 [Ditylenchus destructor]